MAMLLLRLASSTPCVSSFLTRQLEQNYPPAPVNAIGVADAIVVLGGGNAVPESVSGVWTPKPGSWRYWYAACLFHAGKAPVIVVAGGPLDHKVIAALSSNEILDFLVKAGVPGEAIVKLPDSASTAQNALFAKPVVRARSFRRVLLVTSALHMPRALAIFRAVGIDAIPASSDNLTEPTLSHTWLDLVPNTIAWRRSRRVLHEYMGLLLYPLQIEFARKESGYEGISLTAVNDQR